MQTVLVLKDIVRRFPDVAAPYAGTLLALPVSDLEAEAVAPYLWLRGEMVGQGVQEPEGCEPVCPAPCMLLCPYTYVHVCSFLGGCENVPWLKSGAVSSAGLQQHRATDMPMLCSCMHATVASGLQRCGRYSYRRHQQRIWCTGVVCSRRIRRPVEHTAVAGTHRADV